MEAPDILHAIKPVIKAFDQLFIEYYIGGSIASSVYGIARATMDVDIIADIELAKVHPLVGILREEYYIEEGMINDAISDASSFNLIHLKTMMKIDVFIQKEDPYHKSASSRKLKDQIVEGDQDSVFYLSSPENLILSKLCWYDAGNRVSERQWLDVLGVIKVRGSSLDRGYLADWSETLGISDLLSRAFSESDAKL